MPETTPVTCNGPDCETTTWMSPERAEATWYCHPACKARAAEARREDPEAWIRDAVHLLEKASRGQMAPQDQERAQRLVEEAPIDDD